MRISLTSLRRKSLINLLRTWREVKGTARHAFKGEVRPELPREDTEFVRRRMSACLESRGGDVSARARTAELGAVYLQLNRRGRQRFLKLLVNHFGLDADGVVGRLGRLQGLSRKAERLEEMGALRRSLESPALKILKRFNTLPDGFKFLVDLRADLRSFTRYDSGLRALDTELKQLLESWFDIGLLELKEITWDSPASLLEKLIAYEAVHEISSWEDLKNRLDADRRCFAFFHHKIPDEPLIFVETALVQGMADNIQELLDVTSPVVDPRQADTAVFYSISSTQKGLSGIGFGNFLIKQVVSRIGSENPGIKTFATLSPVPKFRSWLDSQHEPGADELLKEPLMRLAARYLVMEKRGTHALDPVAHFHFMNGARLERINWQADTSKKGLRASAGIMVNYLYDPARIEENHEIYAATGEVDFSKQVRSLLRNLSATGKPQNETPVP
jgi:malonyl-CoA decarboxylase